MKQEPAPATRVRRGRSVAAPTNDGARKVILQVEVDLETLRQIDVYAALRGMKRRQLVVEAVLAFMGDKKDWAKLLAQ